MNDDQYILDGETPVRCEDFEKFANWFTAANRRVKLAVQGEVKVSTVFLGIDHNFSEDGLPVLFETMVFGGGLDGHIWRVSTWEEAERVHDNVCKLVGVKAK